MSKVEKMHEILIGNAKRKRPEPIIINSEELKKSIELISKFEYVITGEGHTFSNGICNFCKNFFPIMEGKEYRCKGCGEKFCFKHRSVLNHQCASLTPSTQKYLMAKSLFRTRMRAIKNKGC